MTSISAIITELGPARIAAESGFPIQTICRWRDEDRIPGKGTTQQLKRQQFEAAVEKVRADKAAEETANQNAPDQAGQAA